MNAPRGPSHMRRERNNEHRERERDRDRSRRVDASPSKRDRKESSNSTTANKKKENVKTTMTDFRIVGIEIKELGWTWGMIGGQAMSETSTPDLTEQQDTYIDDTDPIKLESEEEPKAESTEAASTEPEIVQNGDKAANASVEVKEEPSADTAEPSSLVPEANGDNGEKSEPVDEATVTADEAAGKVGAKRKAHSPEAGQFDFSISPLSAIIAADAQIRGRLIEETLHLPPYARQIKRCSLA